jgi:DNA polymerase-3 subunit epsilon
MQKGSAEPVAHFITTTRTGQLLRAQMAPVLRNDAESTEKDDDSRITGYVLTIENITKSFEREAQRDQVMQSLTDGSRASLGNIRAAVENLITSPDMELAYRERFIGIIDEEVGRMSQRLQRTMDDFADSLKTRWPLEDVLGIDVVAAAQRRIEDRLKLSTKSETLDDTLWIRADSFALIQAITFLASRLQDHYDIREVRFRLLAEGKMAFIDLIWSGTTVSSETLYTWELESMTVGNESSPLTLRDMAERHGGEIWYQREKAAHRAFFRLVLPVADTPEVQHVETVPHASGESRPEYYDFDLFKYSDEAFPGMK